MNDTHHPTRAEIAAFTHGDLSAEHIVSVGDHLAHCSECMALAASQGDMGDIAGLNYVAAKLADDAHLTYDEMESYIGGTMQSDLRALALSHLSECQLCKGDVDDLVALQAVISTYPAVEFAPLAKNGHRQWPLCALRHVSSPTVLRVGMVMAALAFCGMLVLLHAHRSTENGGGAHTGVTTQANNPSHSNETGTPPHQPSTSKNVASANVAYSDLGHNITVTNTGAIRVDGASTTIPHLQWSREALGDDDTLGLSPTASQDIPGPKMVYPIRTLVESTTPTFIWTKIPAAVDYTVTVEDATGTSSITVSPKLTATHWQCDASLPRGATLSWTVRATLRTSGEALSPMLGQRLAQFRILDDGGAHRLAAIRRAYPDDKLALGLVQARLGDYHDAASNIADYVKHHHSNHGLAILASSLRRHDQESR